MYEVVILGLQIHLVCIKLIALNSMQNSFSSLLLKVIPPDMLDYNYYCFQLSGLRPFKLSNIISHSSNIFKTSEKLFLLQAWLGSTAQPDHVLASLWTIKLEQHFSFLHIKGSLCDPQYVHLLSMMLLPVLQWRGTEQRSRTKSHICAFC